MKRDQNLLHEVGKVSRRSRDGWGVARCCNSRSTNAPYLGNYQIKSTNYGLIRKSKNAPTLLFKPDLPFRVPKSGLLRIVSPTVDLDNEASDVRREIRSVGTDRHLPPELHAELVVPYRPPDHRLGPGHCPAITSGKFAR